MPKRPDNLETLLLALELLRRIPRRSKVSASDLHAQIEAAGLSRDLRTIQRQLEVLSEHFDIERDDASKPYGYRWKENAAGMSLPMLSEQESLLLLLAKRHLESILPARLMKSMGGFFSQANARLSDPVARKLERQWLGKVRVVSTSQPLIPAKIKDGVFEQVSDALYANRWLDLNYLNAAGKRTQADVMPLGLAQQGPRLYLVCRFRGYDNERSLALHRIQSAKASGLDFDPPADFDLQRYDDDGRFGFGEGQRIKLQFSIAKDVGQHLLETPLSADQSFREYAQHLRISATVVDTAQLEWWLRGFGDQVWSVRRTPAGRGRVTGTNTQGTGTLVGGESA